MLDRHAGLVDVTADGLVTVQAGMPLQRLTAELASRGWAMNAEVFAAARIGVGALGVLSTVTLQAVPAFALLVEEGTASLTELATRLLERAPLTGVTRRRPVPEPARLLVTVLDGVTTTWLVDRDTEATGAVLDVAVELFVGQYAELPG